MNLKMKFVFVVAAVMFSGAVMAKGKTKHKKTGTKETIKLLEAYAQRTIPGTPGGLPPASFHFVIIWGGATYPESFFWRGENGWLTCKTEKAHKITKNEIRNFPPNMEYATLAVGGDEMHKGDTLLLTPIKGGKFPVPAEIPKDAKNTLYYKTGGSKWIAFPIKNIIKKKDVAMP